VAFLFGISPKSSVNLYFYLKKQSWFFRGTIIVMGIFMRAPRIVSVDEPNGAIFATLEVSINGSICISSTHTCVFLKAG